MVLSKISLNSLHYESQSRPGWYFLPFEAIYGFAVKIRLALYRAGFLKTVKLPVPVLSIGNLTTGGTGKTPVTIALAQFLEEKGLKVAVLSRGYAAKKKVDYHEADSPDYGDEPFMIQKNLFRGKVFVGQNRVFTGQQACKIFKPDIILLDDGFQYIRLHKDIDILLVDGQHVFGNGHLLPSGPMREPLSALKRADWVLITRETDNSQKQLISGMIHRMAPEKDIKIATCSFKAKDIFHPASQQCKKLTELADTDLIIFSGIAQPAVFENMIRQNIMCKHLLEHIIFSDHHNYAPKDCLKLEQKLNENPQAIILTTEKDWVKLDGVCSTLLRKYIYFLRIQPCFDWKKLLEEIDCIFR